MLWCPVHPRGGGERMNAARRYPLIAGSSPRGRGTLSAQGCQRVCQRFIPAGAGNATTRPNRQSLKTVHPRGGGERGQRYRKRYPRAGSSPRGRGTPCAPSPVTCRDRFIPAGAGNASGSWTRATSPTVHPRGGGERARVVNLRLPMFGSSPRGRGTRSTVSQAISSRRFIPAGAGNAAPSVRRGSGHPVHPRGGGERTASA